jgi:hypothetical protein
MDERWTNKHNNLQIEPSCHKCKDGAKSENQSENQLQGKNKKDNVQSHHQTRKFPISLKENYRKTGAHQVSRENAVDLE